LPGQRWAGLRSTNIARDYTAGNPITLANLESEAVGGLTGASMGQIAEGMQLVLPGSIPFSEPYIQGVSLQEAFGDALDFGITELSNGNLKYSSTGK
jgi:hypothetical protein